MPEPDKYKLNIIKHKKQYSSNKLALQKNGGAPQLFSTLRPNLKPIKNADIPSLIIYGALMGRKLKVWKKDKFCLCLKFRICHVV